MHGVLKVKLLVVIVGEKGEVHGYRQEICRSSWRRRADRYSLRFSILKKKTPAAST